MSLHHLVSFLSWSLPLECVVSYSLSKSSWSSSFTFIQKYFFSCDLFSNQIQFYCHACSHINSEKNTIHGESIKSSAKLFLFLPRHLPSGLALGTTYWSKTRWCHQQNECALGSPLNGSQY